MLGTFLGVGVDIRIANTVVLGLSESLKAGQTGPEHFVALENGEILSSKPPSALCPTH